MVSEIEFSRKVARLESDDPQQSQDDNIILMDPDTMLEFRIRVNDYVEILGESSAQARVRRIGRAEWGNDIIRLNDELFDETGVDVGDEVKIRK